MLDFLRIAFNFNQEPIPVYMFYAKLLLIRLGIPLFSINNCSSRNELSFQILIENFEQNRTDKEILQLADWFFPYSINIKTISTLIDDPRIEVQGQGASCNEVLETCHSVLLPTASLTMQSLFSVTPENFFCTTPTPLEDFLTSSLDEKRQIGLLIQVLDLPSLREKMLKDLENE